MPRNKRKKYTRPSSNSRHLPTVLVRGNGGNPIHHACDQDHFPANKCTSESKCSECPPSPKAKRSGPRSDEAAQKVKANSNTKTAQKAPMNQNQDPNRHTGCCVAATVVPCSAPECVAAAALARLNEGSSIARKPLTRADVGLDLSSESDEDEPVGVKFNCEDKDCLGCTARHEFLKLIAGESKDPKQIEDFLIHFNFVYGRGHQMPGIDKDVTCTPDKMCHYCDAVADELQERINMDHEFRDQFYRYIDLKKQAELVQEARRGGFGILPKSNADDVENFGEGVTPLMFCSCEPRDCPHRRGPLTKEFRPSDFNSTSKQFILRQAKKYNIDVTKSRILRIILDNISCSCSKEVTATSVPKFARKHQKRKKIYRNTDFGPYRLTPEDKEAVVRRSSFLQYIECSKDDALLVLTIADLLGFAKYRRHMVGMFEHQYGFDFRLEKFKNERSMTLDFKRSLSEAKVPDKPCTDKHCCGRECFNPTIHTSTKIERKTQVAKVGNRNQADDDSEEEDGEEENEGEREFKYVCAILASNPDNYKCATKSKTDRPQIAEAEHLSHLKVEAIPKAEQEQASLKPDVLPISDSPESPVPDPEQDEDERCGANEVEAAKVAELELELNRLNIQHGALKLDVLPIPDSPESPVPDPQLDEDERCDANEVKTAEVAELEHLELEVNSLLNFQDKELKPSESDSSVNSNFEYREFGYYFDSEDEEMMMKAQDDNYEGEQTHASASSVVVNYDERSFKYELSDDGDEERDYLDYLDSTCEENTDVLDLVDLDLLKNLAESTTAPEVGNEIEAYGIEGDEKCDDNSKLALGGNSAVAVEKACDPKFVRWSEYENLFDDENLVGNSRCIGNLRSRDYNKGTDNIPDASYLTPLMIRTKLQLDLKGCKVEKNDSSAEDLECVEVGEDVAGTVVHEKKPKFGSVVNRVARFFKKRWN